MALQWKGRRDDDRQTKRQTEGKPRETPLAPSSHDDDTGNRRMASRRDGGRMIVRNEVTYNNEIEGKPIKSTLFAVAL